MGKKRGKPAATEVEKARLEVRFDRDVYEGLRQLSERAGVSINQLLHGASRWIVANGRVGEPYRGESGEVHERHQEGVVWFGKTCRYWSEDDVHEMRDVNEASDVKVRVGDLCSKGTILFWLDFTERRVVRSAEDSTKDEESTKAAKMLPSKKGIRETGTEKG